MNCRELESCSSSAENPDGKLESVSEESRRKAIKCQRKIWTESYRVSAKKWQMQRDCGKTVEMLQKNHRKIIESRQKKAEKTAVKQ